VKKRIYKIQNFVRENVQFFIRGNIKYFADGKGRRKADTRRLYKKIQSIEVNMKPEETEVELHCECNSLPAALFQLPVSIIYLYSLRTLTYIF